jgi:hypothetical protein
MSSQFNPDTFLDAQYTEATSTQMIPVPDGEWVGTCKSVGKPRQAGESFVMDVRWAITDPQVAAVTGLEESVVNQSLWLDLTPHGTLDMGKGKNVGIGRLREAMGLNQPGQPFTFRMFEGRSAKVRVKQENDRDGVLRAKVTAVAPL